MTPAEFTQNMTFLGLAYNKEFDKNQISVWYQFFTEIEEVVFRKALVRLIQTCKYIPSIAEIKGEISILQHSFLQLDPDEEWNNVQKAIWKYGMNRPEEAMKFLDPFTADVVKHMGGFRKICLSEEGEWQRKSFLKLFNDRMNSSRNTLLFTESQRTLPDQKRSEEIRKLIEES